MDLSVQRTIDISTHILTRRMTRAVFHINNISVYFNSHPHEEDDTRSVFQPLRLLYFNSHPHEEDDGGSLQGGLNGLGISTHILTRRMTTW